METRDDNGESGKVVGVKSDTEAMTRIIRELDDGFVLTRVVYCRPLCPVPVHLHFARRSDSGGTVSLDTETRGE